jgi:hypothetical protein
LTSFKFLFFLVGVASPSLESSDEFKELGNASINFLFLLLIWS